MGLYSKLEVTKNLGISMPRANNINILPIEAVHIFSGPDLFGLTK